LNKRLTRKWLPAVAVLGLGVSLVACGSSKSDTASDASTTDTAAATADTMASTTDTAAPDATAVGSTSWDTNFTPWKDGKPVNCKPATGPLKAAWIYVGPINDGGWTQAHHEGLKAVQAKFGDQVVTTYKENIPEGPQVLTTIDQLVKDGNTVIFGTSFGFQDAFVTAAGKYPNVCFEFETGFKSAANLSQAYGAGEDGDYLAGMAAGAASKTGKVGYLAPFAIPEVIRGANAFTLGVRNINPAATVQVVWTGTWFDPAKERQAAESLISAGVDAISSAQDSPAAGEAAKAKNVPWVGYDSDQNANFPEVWLTATTYHWGVYEVPRIQQVLDGTWVAGDYYGGLDDGFVKMATFGKLVSADTQAKILAKQAELAANSGSQFTGPLKAQDGTEKIAAGASASYGDLMGMNYLVEGVLGDLPKS